MQSITTLNATIHFNAKAYQALNSYLKDSKISKIFILVDENTEKACLPILINNFSEHIVYSILTIPSGEEFKTIETCNSVWRQLSKLNADRKSMILNLGGGVVTDLGGFVASTFKRGVKFINIPTSLLAMVDASIGGKTGVDLDGLKNQIGVINFSEMVLIDCTYLKSLPQEHFRSGLAEMLKHGLIYDQDYWIKMCDYIRSNSGDIDSLVYDSVLIKNDIVSKDPYENGVRKSLNFGHTLGHAIETYFLNDSKLKTLLHGDAIAIGMILETFISYKLKRFPDADLQTIKIVIQDLFGKIEIQKLHQKPIIDLLKFDKKNAFGSINFVLLESIGKPIIDCQVDNHLIYEAFDFYNG